MELLFTKERALTNMSERQRIYRANYRQRVAGWYNGFLHIGIIYAILRDIDALTRAPVLAITIVNVAAITAGSVSEYWRMSLSPT